MLIVLVANQLSQLSTAFLKMAENSRHEFDKKVVGEDFEVIFEDVKLVKKYEDNGSTLEEVVEKADDFDEEYSEAKYEDKEYIEQFEDQDSPKVARQIQVNSHNSSAEFERGGD